MNSLYPICVFDRCDDAEADAALSAWGHYLGPCNRPFGRQSFALRFDGRLACVAVSASAVSASVEGYSRYQVIELARLCSHPDYRDLTRVAVRIWRKVADAEWTGEYKEKWPRVLAYSAYSENDRHEGRIYRFDGWVNAGSRRGSIGGGTYTQKKNRADKTLWLYRLAAKETP